MRVQRYRARVPPRHVVLLLRLIQARDRARLRRLQRRHPGLAIDPTASTNLAVAEYHLGEGARLEIGPHVEVDRREGGLRFHVEDGAHVRIGEGSWIRSHLQPTIINAFAGARIDLGPRCWLSGCHLSSKERLTVGRESMIGPGSRVFDCDHHDLDEARREQTQPVEIGDYVWVASDVTVLKGVHIGSHCVIGARSLVTRSVPPHTLAVGFPARRVGEIGDRSRLPHV